MFRAPCTKAGERLAGLSSIYGSSTPGMATPGVGEYNVDKGAAAVSLHGESAIFKDETDRFLRHDGIYAQAVASTASSNPLPPSASPATLARALGLPGFATNANDLPLRDQTTAAFRGNDDRFEDRWSVYHANTSGMTPGVGTYTTDGTSSDLSFTKDSSFASSTDRFLLPHGVYTDQPGGESPAVGVYEASKAYEATQAARVRGAVKLQAAVRRRQSRGIFAQIEAEACQVPAPGHYAPELLPQLAKPKRPAPSEKQMADAAAKALLASTLDTLEEATAALESLAVVDEERSPATESSATVGGADAAEEKEQQAATPASPPMSPLRSGSMLGPIAASPVQMPSAMKVPAEAAYVPSPAAYQSLASAPILPRLSADADELAASPVVREPPRGRLSRIVSLDTWLAEMSDDGEDSQMPSMREEEEWIASPGGLKVKTTVKDETDNVVAEDEAEDGDWLFSQLERICDVSTHSCHAPQTLPPDMTCCLSLPLHSAMTIGCVFVQHASLQAGTVMREDYYDEDSGWDIEGMRSDLALYAAIEVA